MGHQVEWLGEKGQPDIAQLLRFAFPRKPNIRLVLVQLRDDPAQGHSRGL
jgi:hypothetical protein